MWGTLRRMPDISNVKLTLVELIDLPLEKGTMQFCLLWDRLLTTPDSVRCWQPRTTVYQLHCLLTRM